jgi:2-polyprenyl-6-hydroxyphenyl methylase / 3-demethylubiquinone-9 3-methyltransferase
MKKASDSSTIDEKEILKFTAIADEWWDEGGKFFTLHQINPLRIQYIKDQILLNFKKSPPYEDLTLLDIGCGGGLISVPMCRLGAKVTGIDASEKNIKIAMNYIRRTGLTIDFNFTTAEDLSMKNKKFDVILALEVIEHVNQYELFLKSMSSMLNKHGIIIISTINKTLKSLVTAKFLAEYILRWVPKGTHDWEKFIKPQEIDRVLSNLGLKTVDIKGMNFNPFINQKWELSSNKKMNYIAVYRRK